MHLPNFLFLRAFPGNPSDIHIANVFLVINGIGMGFSFLRGPLQWHVLDTTSFTGDLERNTDIIMSHYQPTCATNYYKC